MEEGRKQQHIDVYLPYELSIEVDAGVVKLRVSAKEKIDSERLREALGEALKAVWDLKDDIVKIHAAINEIVRVKEEAVVEPITTSQPRPLTRFQPIQILPDGSIKFISKAIQSLSIPEAVAVLLYQLGAHRPKEMAEKISKGFKKVSESSIRAYLTGSESKLAKYVFKNPEGAYELTEEGRNWVAQEVLPKIVEDGES